MLGTSAFLMARHQPPLQQNSTLHKADQRTLTNLPLMVTDLGKSALPSIVTRALSSPAGIQKKRCTAAAAAAAAGQGEVQQQGSSVAGE
jgi:hypothetical protein